MFDPKVLCFDRLDLIRFCLEQLEWIKNLIWLCLTNAKKCSTVFDKSVLCLDGLEKTDYLSTDSTEAKMCLTVFDPSVLCFFRLDLIRLYLDQKFNLTVLIPSVLTFARLDLNWLGFDRLDFRENVLDSVRPKHAKFRPTRLDLAMLQPTRLNQNSNWICSTHACYVLTDSIWTGYVWTDSAEAKTGFDWVWPERIMFRPNRLKQKCVWLCSAQAF